MCSVCLSFVYPCLLLIFFMFVVMIIIFIIFQSDSDAVSSIFGALDSIHASLAVMAHKDMPKQLYKEEVDAINLYIC